jgi:hypothetical protein
MKDDSVLDIKFRFDDKFQLSEVGTVAITGFAAELLALVVKKRNGFFGVLIPLTEGEVQFLALTNKNAVA